MKLKVKKDIGYFCFFLFLFLLISRGGIVKYIILSGLASFFILIKRWIKKDYFLISWPVVTYIIVGMGVSIFTGNISYDSVKQSLIFISALFIAIAIYSLYGNRDSGHLIDIQFIALCIAYLLLYAKYFTWDALYYESCLYAYIFGTYVLIYFIRKKYVYMSISILFLLFDHKRIANAATVLIFMCVLIILLSKKKQYQKVISKIAHIFLILMPILWAFFCNNGLLGNVFAKLGINTMGRLEGTGAWNIAKECYELSPLYWGRGSGWVLNWLESAGIPNFSNLHNDFLTAYIELGFWGFGLWVLAFQLVLLKVEKKKGLYISNIVAALFAFMFINLLTDNIYLYITFLVPFYIVLLYVIFDDKTKSIVLIE